MLTLKNWTAKRVGAHITIRGEAADGGKVILVGVLTITGSPMGAVALHKDGTSYRLT